MDNHLLIQELTPLPSIHIRQRRELVELLGFETRNKYEINDQDGRLLGFAAEQSKGVLGFLLRQFLGHWRRFEIHVFDRQKQLAWIGTHPFRWFFQRLEIKDNEGQSIGAIQQRWAILHKRFDVEDAGGRVIMEVKSPLWRIWTFPFIRRGETVAVIEKKWGGILKEVFTDGDTFRIQFQSTDLSAHERALIVTAGLFIDLQYFEQKAD